MKKFLNHWPIIGLFVFSILIVWPLFVPGYFSHHDDLQVMRIFEMRRCFADLQIPCRWVPDMGYGNGYPLFNFYGVFAYYLGAVFSYVLGYVASAKALFFIPLVAGGVGMYLLAKEIYGKAPGFIAGVLYLFAPYRALDSYVRGAVAELFAMTAVPFILFFVLRLTKTGKIKYFFWAVISFSIFLLSHNIMTLLFAPVILLITLYFLYKDNFKNWKKVLWVGIIGVGISAFFIFPAYLEKGLVQTASLTRAELDFRAQFVKVGQLFVDRSWNYAGSNPDQGGTISYQIGWPLWWLVTLALGAFAFAKGKDRGFPGILFALFAFSIFMTHNKSAPVWETVKILAYVQFPWRFLSIAIFTGSLIVSYLATFFRGKGLKVFAAITLFLAVVLNWQYFRPEHFYYDVTDQTKLSGQSFVDQQKGSLLDYLPKTALEPREPAPEEPIFVEGSGQVSGFVDKSNSWSFSADVKQNATIDVPVFDFPNWMTTVDGNKVPHSASFPSGRIEIGLGEGVHAVAATFNNTAVRTVSNLLTLTSLLGFLFLLKYGKNTKVFG